MVPRVLLAVILLLTACIGDVKVEDLMNTRGSQSGIRTLLVLAASVNDDLPLPASIAGVTASLFLGRGDAISPDTEPISGAENPNSDIALLNIIVKIMRQDVQDILNRSTSRADALQAYTASVRMNLQKGEIRKLALESAGNMHRDDERRIERRVRTLNNDLQDAIRDGNAETANAITAEMMREQSALTSAKTEGLLANNLSSAYEEILEPLSDRLRAIEANSDALIKGVRVTDIPGAEDIGVITIDERGVPRIRRATRGLF